jgi:hypothetical protein
MWKPQSNVRERRTAIARSILDEGGSILLKMCTTLRVPLPYLTIDKSYPSDTRLDDQNLCQIEVETGDLNEFGKEMARLLQERLKTHVETHGSVLMLQNEDPNRHIRPKDVKMQVKHVLHRLGFSHDYRVLSEHNLIRIVRVEKRRRYVEKAGVVPSPTESLPYLFPT